jgi:hypothetical protein
MAEMPDIQFFKRVLLICNARPDIVDAGGSSLNDPHNEAIWN